MYKIKVNSAFFLKTYLILFILSFTLLIQSISGNTINYSLSFKVFQINSNIHNSIADKFFFLSKNQKQLVNVIKELQNENQILKAELFEARKKDLEIAVLKDKNSQLSDLLNIRKDLKITQFITINIADSILTEDKALLVSIPEGVKIENQTLVITNNGVLGYIRSINNNHMLIITNQNKDFKISAVSSETNTNLIISGNLTATPNFDIYKNTNLKDGELIVTSALEGFFPKNIPIGRVIIDSNGKPQIILFENLKNLQYMHMVK